MQLFVDSKELVNPGERKFEKTNGTPPSPRFLTDLKFHDLRHQTATTWSKYLHAQELAKMFGWKTLELVMIYYKSDIQTIADKLTNPLMGAGVPIPTIFAT